MTTLPPLELPELPDLPPPPPWLLYQGEMGLRVGNGRFSGEGRVWLSLLEDPEVRVEVKGQSEGAILMALNHELGGAPDPHFKGTVPLTVKTTAEGERTSGHSVSISFNNNEIHSHLNQMDHGDPDMPVETLRSHLLNFAEPANFTDSHLLVGPWRLALRSIPDAHPRLQAYCPTQVLDVRRADGSAFPPREADHLLEWICDALTFAAGRVVGSALVQGFRSDKPTFLRWSCSVTDPWRHAQSWWDPRVRTTQPLESLLNQWSQAASDEQAAQVLRRIARIYASVHMTSTLDTAIPIAGVGLELMAWDALRRREQLITADEFDRKLPTASTLRLALRLAGIPTELPTSLTSLQSFVSGELVDAPFALTQVRNRLTHPPKPKAEWPGVDPMIEARNLAIDYLGLLVLASIGYTGTYRPVIGASGHPGEERPVPWASRVNDGAQEPGDRFEAPPNR